MGIYCYQDTRLFFSGIVLSCCQDRYFCNLQNNPPIRPLTDIPGKKYFFFILKKVTLKMAEPCHLTCKPNP